MRILLLTPDLPYPSESGAALRNMGLIRGLAAAGHQLTLLSFAEAPPTADNPLHALCDSLHVVPLPSHPKAATRCADCVSSTAAWVRSASKSVASSRSTAPT